MPAAPILPPASTADEFIETPLTIEEIRMLISIKVAVAPRTIFAQLAKSSTPALARDRACEVLVDHLTRDMRLWRFVRVVRAANLQGSHPDQHPAPTHSDGTARISGGGK